MATRSIGSDFADDLPPQEYGAEGKTHVIFAKQN
jgi:hypothetical protein